MVYVLSLFRELAVASGQSWEALKKYLTSNAGGQLVITESECGRYAIIHYDKTTSNMSVPHVRWFRSVVWDIQTMKPLSVAPPACNEPITATEIPTITKLQEYLDGININIYRGKTDTALQLASRSSFGAKGTFYSKKSFAELFHECLSVADESIKASFSDENCTPVEGEFSRFVSVLIQHPEHRIVESVSEPRIWFLHIGVVRDNGDVVMNEDASNIPEVAPPTNGEDMHVWFDRLCKEHDWKWRGVVLKDGNGQRWRIANSSYEIIRSLRGNMCRSSERFFNLRRQGMVPTYLVYYPEDMETFKKYEEWIRVMTSDLYELYTNVYRKKSVTAYASYWHKHLAALHSKYTKVLRPNGKKMTKADVIEYVNELPVPRLMFLLRVTVE